MHKRRLLLAVATALFLLNATVQVGLTHSGGDSSLTHQIIDSPVLPFLGVGTLVLVSVIWLRAQPKQGQ